MKAIYKYELPIAPGFVSIINEKIIKILKVDYQNGLPMVWAMVDTEDIGVESRIMSFGTGWELPNGVEEYVGSLQDSEGYVWHYFIVERTSAENKFE